MKRLRQKLIMQKLLGLPVKILILKGLFSQFLPPDTMCYVFLFCWDSKSWSRWFSESEHQRCWISRRLLQMPWDIWINTTRIVLTESKMGKACIPKPCKHILGRSTPTDTDICMHTHVKRSELQAVNHQASVGIIFYGLKFFVLNVIGLQNAKYCLGIIFKPYLV